MLVELRAGLIEAAASVALEAVQAHEGTGRLWAIYIQLCHRLEVKYFYETEAPLIQSRLPYDVSKSAGASVSASSGSERLWLSKERVIHQAISQVPKSGEVWCERGRCQLNPLSVHCFDLSQAQRSLCFAIQFTPQYGDTFIEYVRLEMLCQVILPTVLELLGVPVIPFVQAYLYEDSESDIVEITRDPRRIKLNFTDCVMSVPGEAPNRAQRSNHIVQLEQMQHDLGDLSERYRNIAIMNLNRR